MVVNRGQRGNICIGISPVGIEIAHGNHILVEKAAAENLSFNGLQALSEHLPGTPPLDEGDQAILFLSEILPKTIGAVYWKRLAPGVTRLLAWLMVPLRPFVWLSAHASRAISSQHDPVHVSRDEIMALADLGAQQGVLDEDESRVLQSLLRFRSMTASQVMTPRTVIFGLPADLTVGETVERHRPLRYSRIPVFRASIDQLVGVVLKDEILERAAKGEADVKLDELRRELFYVPGTLRLSHLLDLLLSSREHIAAVIDEFGGTAGLVTLEDLIETLLDLEIVDEVDDVENLREVARSQWRQRASELGVLSNDSQPGPTD